MTPKNRKGAGGWVTLPALAVSLLLLGSCQSAGTMQPSLDHLKGKPLDVAVRMLGAPTDERKDAGQRIAIWSSNHEGTYSVSAMRPVTTYMQGMPVTTYVASPQTETYKASCTVKASVDANGIVKSWAVSGQGNGCDGYAQKLKTALPTS